MMRTVRFLSNDWMSAEESFWQLNERFTLARAISFLESEEVRKIESENQDALLSQRKRLSLRRFSDSVPEMRLASGRGFRRRNFSARGIALAPNQQGALVAKKMDETDRPIEEPGRAGVTVLAEEIDERLSSAKNSTTAELRGIRKEFTHRLKDAAPHVVIELAGLLIDVHHIHYRFVAYELIHHHPAALSHLNAWQLEQLGRGISSWGAVDCFAVYLAGPVWRGRRVPNSLIHSWAKSADRWWRRAALVSTVPLNSKARGGEGDAYRTLQVCRLLERDRDPMVAKALSWALRELAKRDPRAVREFITSRNDVLPAIVLREVTNKLKTGVKNPKLKSKAAAKN
jgi:3-methyladenine DNA glycosylase AlkD